MKRFIRAIISFLRRLLARPADEPPTRTPTTAEDWFDYGNQCEFQDRFEESIEAMTKAIELQPAFAEAYFNRGSTYELLERYNEAVADYRRGIEFGGIHEIGSHIALARVRIEAEGTVFHGPSLAREHVERAATLADDMTDWHVHQQVAQAFAMIGDSVRARATLERAIDLLPVHLKLTARMMRAELAHHLDDPETDQP